MKKVKFEEPPKEDEFIKNFTLECELCKKHKQISTFVYDKKNRLICDECVLPQIEIKMGKKVKIKK